MLKAIIIFLNQRCLQQNMKWFILYPSRYIFPFLICFITFSRLPVFPFFPSLNNKCVYLFLLASFQYFILDCLTV